MNQRSPSPHRLLWLAISWLAAPSATAQAGCYDLGSEPVAAQWTAAPVVMTCPRGVTSPQWHLFTPAHAAPRSKPGFNPGDARPRAAWLVRWRCSPFFGLPVIPASIRPMGYVVHQAEYACAPDP